MHAIANGSRPAATPDALGIVRHDWTRDEIDGLYRLSFPELMFRAQVVHRMRFDPDRVQVATLLSIKTGGCPEDCAYCPQSVRYETGVAASKLMVLEAVIGDSRGRQGGRCPSVLHGRCVAFAKGPRSGRRLRVDRGREGSGP